MLSLVLKERGRNVELASELEKQAKDNETKVYITKIIILVHFFVPIDVFFFLLFQLMSLQQQLSLHEKELEKCACDLRSKENSINSLLEQKCSLLLIVILYNKINYRC